MKRFEESLEAARAEYLSQPATPPEQGQHSVFAVRAGRDWAQNELPSYMVAKIMETNDQTFCGENGEDIFTWNSIVRETAIMHKTSILNELKDIPREQGTITDEHQRAFVSLVAEAASPDLTAAQSHFMSHTIGTELGALSIEFLRLVPDNKLTEVATDIRAAVYEQEGPGISHDYDPRPNSWYSLRVTKTNQATLRRNFTRAAITNCTGDDPRNQRTFMRRYTTGVDDKADEILRVLKPDYFTRNRTAYQTEMSHESIISNPDYAEEIIEILESGAEALEAYYNTRFKSQELMTAGNHLFQTTLSRLSQSGSINAGKVLDILRSQQKSSFLGVTKVANMLMNQVGNGVFDASGAEVPIEPLDERSMYSIPTAFSRILHVCQDLGESSTTIDEETKENARLVTEVASLLMQCGIDRKLEQPAPTIGDIVMRYPHATAEELSNIINDLESDSKPSDPHATYRDIRAQYGSRVYWNRSKTGYGLIS